jgi:hypothetical protein
MLSTTMPAKTNTPAGLTNHTATSAARPDKFSKTRVKYHGHVAIRNKTQLAAITTNFKEIKKARTSSIKNNGKIATMQTTITAMPLCASEV